MTSRESTGLTAALFPDLIKIAARVGASALACALLAGAVAMLTGCAGITPDSIVARAPVRAPADPIALAATPNRGAIYQPDQYRPMFEDRRARLVGDTLVITISERSTAGKNVASSGSKDGSADILLLPQFGGMDMEASGKLSHSDKAAANAANNFTSTLAVTVVEVRGNGYLAVRGEKQIALDRGTEYIRFSGLVNPSSISAVNSVASTQVADLRVEYRTNSQIDKAALQSALARFFLSVLPL